MKAVTLAILALVTWPALALSPGDDVVSFYRAQAKVYASSRPLQPLEGFTGYETAVLATDRGFTKPPFVLVVRKVGGAVVFPFGAVDGKADEAVLLLDTDADGKLDLKTVTNVVPGWLALKLPLTKGTGKEFRALADRIYRQYDQNGGPVPAQLSLLVENLKARAADENNPDRDLDLALNSALEQAISEPQLAAGTLSALSAALKTRGGDHPLPQLYRGEALVALGRTADANAAFAALTGLDPRSTIGAFKKVQEDPAGLATFRAAHPDFWASRR